MVKETAQPKDQSMEEILQSIKRIIAEEGSEPAPELNGAGHDMDSPVKGSEILELKDIDEGNDSGVLELTEEVEEEAPEKTDTPFEPPRVAAQDEGKRDVLADIDSLLSDEAAKVSAAALRSLSSASNRRESGPRGSAAFRSGTTVEDLVIEALKPMLKDWLDANLPDLVRQLVEKEIRKLSS